MKHVSKQVVYFTLCGTLLTGLLGGISAAEASPLQLNNNMYQNEPIQMDDHRDDRHRHHRHHDYDNDNNDGGGDNLVGGLIAGVIVGSIIANN